MRACRALALLLVLVIPALAAAQPEATPPDPVRLDADWWSYFEPGEDIDTALLASRIELASAVLDELETRLATDPDSDLPALIETVEARLRRYGEFRATGPPEATPAVAARDSYSLAELRGLVERLRRVASERSAEALEIGTLERAIASGEREQSQRKVAYLALEPAAPERARRGLELMQSRLRLELAEQELAFREARLANLESELKQLQSVLDTAAQRLTAQEDAIAAVQQERAKAEQRAAALRSQLARLELEQSSVLALAASEQAQAQLQAQRGATVEAEALTEELLATQLAVAEVLLRRAAADNAGDPAPHRRLAREFRDQIAATRERREQIGSATLRSRTAAISRIAVAESGDVRELLRQRIEATDETERQLAALDERLGVADQFGQLLGSQLTGAEGKVGSTLQFLGSWIADGWTAATELASLSLFEISGTPVTALGIVRMLLIMTVAWWISKLARRGLTSVAARRQSINHGSIYTLGRVLHYAILALGIMVALSSIGLDFTKFALFASALGVGIGFGLQTLVSNFVAGLIILFEKSLKIGDFVELESGVTGEVKEINMRSTLVTTNDNIDIVVPNSEFVNSRVTNWTMREAYRRIHVPFGVAYGTDKDLVKTAALEAAAAVDLTLTGQPRRDPQVWFVEFGDSSLNFELVLGLKPDAVKRPAAVQAAYLWAIDDMLRKHEIEVPFPQRDLHLRSAFGLHDNDGQRLLRPAGRGEQSATD